MTPQRFQEISGRYPSLRIAIAGDFCLDRYFDIDPARSEISIETGLEVHNITRVRCQPGAAGTILNNVLALGTGSIIPIGCCGHDGEGWELLRSLESRRGVTLAHFVQSPERRTFTYTKPLVFTPGQAPRELNRLDIKNWTPTPEAVSIQLANHLESIASAVDALILMDQVDIAGTGVVTPILLQAVKRIAEKHPGLPIIADSRRGLGEFPKVIFKMNNAELSTMTGLPAGSDIPAIRNSALQLAQKSGKPVFVTLAERGIVGANPSGETAHVRSLPLRGEIDIVGAGDSVTANLACALAAGASIQESIEIASCAASIVIHQLGTTGTASPEQIAPLLGVL